VEFAQVQILVVVAIIRFRTPKAEEEKGFPAMAYSRKLAET